VIPGRVFFCVDEVVFWVLICNGKGHSRQSAS
jgi:hypothetical protein